MTDSKKHVSQPISEEEVLRHSLRDAAAAGDDDQMLEAIVQLLEWEGCRGPVSAWLNRLPEELRSDTVMLLATTIRLNAAGIAAAEDLEAEMRWMYFITALCSPDERVLTALGRGRVNPLAANDMGR
jgi:hypothetical protein